MLSKLENCLAIGQKILNSGKKRKMYNGQRINGENPSQYLIGSNLDFSLCTLSQQQKIILLLFCH